MTNRSEIENSLELKISKYASFGRGLFELVSQDQGVELREGSLDRLELAWRVAAWVDYKIDTGSLSRGEVANLLINPEVSLLPVEYKKLSNLFPSREKFSRFILRAVRAIKISENVSIINRHRESIYFAQALVFSMCLSQADETKMLKVIYKMSSAGNFIDDVLDAGVDGTGFLLNLKKLGLFGKQFVKGLRALNSPIKVLFEFAKLTRKARSLVENKED